MMIIYSGRPLKLRAKIVLDELALLSVAREGIGERVGKLFRLEVFRALVQGALASE
jgi:hypothetical protein